MDMSAVMEKQTSAMRGNGSQAVSPGYTRTEVGVIPEDWEVGRLGQLSGFITKGATPTTYGYKWEESGVLFLRSECVSAEGLDLAQSMYISDAAHVAIGRSHVRDGDILITITGNVGRVVLLTGIGSANINQHIARIRIIASDADNQFVHYYLSQDYVRQAFEGITTGQAYPQISLVQVREAQVALPSLPEQRAIAEALSDVDALLDALEALIAKKRAIKQTAMQQLLTGKTRLPGFSGKWETKRLGDVADIKNGATPSTQVASYWDGTIPWCTPTDITSTHGKYLSKTERRITEAGLASCAASLLPPGSLLLCSRATIGEVRIAQTEICTNQGFKSLVCRQGISNEFLYYVLLTLKPQLLERAIGSTFLEIGKRDIASISTSLPSIEEQTAIATILSDMDVEITALEARRDKTRAIKQGMMQQLLTGRVRLIKNEVSN